MAFYTILCIGISLLVDYIFWRLTICKHCMSNMANTEESDAQPRIQLGDYIVIQRQKYTKLHKFGNLDSTAMLGKEQLELRALLGQPYDSTFRMCPKEGKGPKGRNQRLQTLELCTETEMRNIRDVLGISASGADNRNIRDDGGSQALGPEDIEQLRGECNESTKIIEKIIENSKTFHEKTEYSQEKYLKKKEKKYFEFVQIRQPTIRLITEIFYRQDPDKIMGIRMDALSQIISYAGVCAYGNYLLYESGSNGLLPASFLNSIGAGTEATLVHMHPGNVPQKQALLALNLPEEQLNRCISVNIYSLLRECYQGEDKESDGAVIADDVKSDEIAQKEANEPEVAEPSSKKQKLDHGDKEVESMEQPPADVKIVKQPKWQLENRRAAVLMHEKLDSLVVAAKEHPTNIVKALLPFVKPSRPVVVFSTCKEVLMELYVELKTSSNVTKLHLTSNWLRMYQILPNRTHPEVNMNSNGGYILSGYTVS